MKNKDIMSDMKHGKFFVIPVELTDEMDSDTIIVILTDVSYWCINFDKLFDWCKRNSVELKGMTLVFSQPEKLTEFILRWS